MNFVSIIGSLVNKPELNVHGELKYTRFSIAVSSYSKGEKKTEFFDVVAFGNNAENICKYLGKGYTIPIAGHLHQEVHTTKEGKKVSSVCIYLDMFTAADSDFVPFN